MNGKGIVLNKNKNVKVLLQAIRAGGSMQKRELEKQTGLSFATVSGICNDLVRKGVLEEIDEPGGAGTGAGRIPKRVQVKRRAFYGVCVDLQSRGIAEITLIDLCGERVFTIGHRYGDPADVEGLVRGCQAAFIARAWEEKLSLEQMIGVGVSIPGIFDLESENVEECAIPQWDGVNMKALFQQAFDLPAYVDNQTNLYASQMLFGEEADVAYLHVGEGLGLGVIVKGRLLRGARGYSSEISHLPIGDPALKCPRCGGYGCAETELSVSGFLAKYKARTGRDAQWAPFVQAALCGDADAVAAVEESAEVLAKCVTTLLTIFDPGRLIIGNYIGCIYPLMEPAVRRHVERLGKNYAGIPIEVDPLGEEAVLRGTMEMLLYKWEL